MTTTQAPRVWAVCGKRAGETAQILGLCEALGWPFEVKRIVHRDSVRLMALARRATDAGIDRGASAPLDPPWPDLVVSAGFVNEPVCRWIARQSGGATRVVMIGRTWCAPETFDLTVTTPQYRLPAHARVIENPLTLHRVTRARLDTAARSWRERVGHLPAPRIAVLVGGDSGPYAFGVQAATRLARAASAHALRRGGSLLVSTSARTRRDASARLAQSLTAPAEVFIWRKGVTGNPYEAFLGLADEIIVTADSIAMISEAIATGRPVHLFDPGVGRWAMRRDAPPLAGECNDLDPRTFFYRLLLRFGPRRLGRDIRLVHERLIEGGHAAWLGEPHLPSREPLPDARARTVAWVRGLLSA